MDGRAMIRTVVAVPPALARATGQAGRQRARLQNIVAGVCSAGPIRIGAGSIGQVGGKGGGLGVVTMIGAGSIGQMFDGDSRDGRTSSTGRKRRARDDTYVM